MALVSSWAAIQVDPASFNADEMILLTDGSVLIHNANTSPTNLASAGAAQWLRMKPDKYGNYANPSWSSTITMSTARQYFASGMLRDGRVFVIGGEISNDLANTAPTPGLDSPLGEIFDPVTNKWTLLNKPQTFNYIKGDVPASVLADGRVLVGGINNPPQTAIWDPAYNTWAAAGTGGAKAARPNEETWTLLPDGSVLTVDVFSAPPNLAERYIPATDAWVTAFSPPDNLVLTQIGTVPVNEIGPAILLPSGTMFAIGATGQTALYDPAGINPWSAGPSFPADTSGSGLNPTLTAIDAPACLLPNGKVVCLGGLTAPLPQPPAAATGYFSNNVTFLEFDPSTNATTIPSLDKQPGTAANPWPGANTFTYQCWFLLLPSGQLLCSAGQNTLYLYTPDGAPQPGWQPTITSVPTTMVTGETYTITGTQLNGLSQAVSYGDDGQMATNYPLVRLTNISVNPQTVAYLRTFNFSSLGVAVAGQVSADLEVPCDLTPGGYNFQVIANGIASDPVPVQIAGRSTENPFAFPSVVPAGHFGGWLRTGGDGADDLGDDIAIGKHNYLTDHQHPAEDSCATQIQNIAEENACFTAQNQSTGDGVVGIFGESDGCRGSIGVGGAATGWGVAGVATSEPVDVLNSANNPDFTAYPSNVGVFGAGDNFGVYGQNRASESQQATRLPPPGNVGVYGVGDATGVQGDSDHVDPTGDDIGTGVVGTSIQGIGVLGQGVGSPNPAATIAPYIGVSGLSQANPTLPYPTSPDYVGTGVLGVGDVRGGVFEATPDASAETFANVRLSPLPLGTAKNAMEPYNSANVPPRLPGKGMPGDVVAAHTTNVDGVSFIELWVCVRPAGKLRGQTVGASWARIQFDNVVTMPGA
jgi:Galactose oxidase, central domain